VPTGANGPIHGASAASSEAKSRGSCARNWLPKRATFKSQWSLDDVRRNNLPCSRTTRRVGKAHHTRARVANIPQTTLSTQKRRGFRGARHRRTYAGSFLLSPELKDNAAQAREGHTRSCMTSTLQICPHSFYGRAFTCLGSLRLDTVNSIACTLPCETRPGEGDSETVLA
jgi:hypothetical protein